MKQYAIRKTATYVGLTWEQVLGHVSDMEVLDICIRLIGSDPL